jgi:hypothetical protein
LLFLMSVRWAGVIAAVVAACFASCNLAHLFFARTEPLISCSELLSVVAFATSIHVWNAEGVQVRRGFALLGLLVGLSFLLHASARAPAIVALGIGLWGFTWRRRERGRDAVLGGAQMLALASLLAVAAAGPYLVKLTWYYLSTPGSASAVRGVPLYELIEAICARYLKTLELLWGAPLALHFQGQPLISRTTAVVVFVGVVSSLVRRQGAGLACIVFVALVLLANSAVAPEVNAGHRVLAALPAICLLAGLGVAVLVDVVKRVGRRYWVASIVVPVLCLMPAFVNTALFFFLDEAAQVETSRSRRMLYSSLRHIVESSEVRTRIYSFKTLCLYSKEGSWLADELRMLHVIDFFKFFLPKHNYQSQVSRNIEDPDSVIVAPGCKEFDPGRIKRWTFDCTGRPVWVCPGPEKQTPVYLME